MPPIASPSKQSAPIGAALWAWFDRASAHPAWRSPRFWAAFFAVVTIAVTVQDTRFFSKPDRFQTYREKWHIRNDFTTFSFAAAWAVRRGLDPYDARNVVVYPADGEFDDATPPAGRQDKRPWNERPGKSFNYFPLNAVLLLPFTLLPVPMAQGAWFALNLVLLIWALRAHGALAGGVRVPWLVWLAALAVAFRFVLDNLALGQWNLPVYNLTVLGLYLIVARRMAWRGGALVGLAAAIKFMPAGFALYFAARRQWRAAAAIALAMGFWVLVFPSLIVGPHRHAELLHGFRGQARDRAQIMVGSNTLSGHSLMATIRVYLSPTSRGSSERDRDKRIDLLHLSPAAAARVAKGVCVALVVATFLASLPGGAGAPPGRRTLVELGMWFMLYLLVSPEVRKAQMLTSFTAAFALGLCLAGRRWLAGGALAAGFALVLLSSLGDEGAWNDTLVLYGSYTLFLLIFWGALLALRSSERSGAQPI